jgi:hypothetical protein
MPRVSAISSERFPPTAIARATVSRKSLTSLSLIALALGFFPCPFFVPFGLPLFDLAAGEGGGEEEAGGAASSLTVSRGDGEGGREVGVEESLEFGMGRDAPHVY